MPVTAAPTDKDLPAGVFDVEFNEHLVWHVVRNELAGRRQGTHSTKTRGMVRGGGQKPWRQKGTGRARQGSRTSPQWAGGGVVFGPSPRTYGGKINRKERLKALRASLSMHRQRGSLGILSDGDLETPSTKEATALRGSFEAGAGKLLVICTLEQQGVYKSFRNLRDVLVVPVTDLEAADVMWARGMLITESALERLGGGQGGTAS